MAFKMKGHTLPGINQRSEGKNLSDGRAKSSVFQKDTDPTDKPDMDKQKNIANPDGGTWKGSGRPKTYKSLQKDGTYKVMTNKSGSRSKSNEELVDTHVTQKQSAKNRADYLEQENKKVTDKRNRKQKRKEGRKKLASKVKGIFTGGKNRKRQQGYENLLDQ